MLFTRGLHVKSAINTSSQRKPILKSDIIQKPHNIQMIVRFFQLY